MTTLTRILLPLLAAPLAFAAEPAPVVPAPAPAETRLKDVVRLRGAVKQDLMGEGLVIGLAGTGDKSPLTKKLAQRFYKEMGSSFDLSDFDSKNMAAVVVTADLPPFLSRGDRIDVEVSSTNGASSLKNGRLLSTPLSGPGPDPAKPILALAQGSVQVGDEKAPPGASAPSGHLTVGRVVNGGQVLDPNPGRGEVIQEGRLALLLRNPDFANAQRVAEAVNAEFLHDAQTAVARATDANRVEVALPKAYQDAPVGFLSRLMELPVTLLKERARVIVNVRTGVVVATGDVRLSTARVSYGENGAFLEIPEGEALSKVMQMLKVATVNQKIEVLNALKAAGALQAELVIQ